MNILHRMYLSDFYKNNNIFQHRWAYASVRLFFRTLVLVLPLYLGAHYISFLQRQISNPLLEDLYGLKGIQLIDVVIFSAFTSFFICTLEMSRRLFVLAGKYNTKKRSLVNKILLIYTVVINIVLNNLAGYIGLYIISVLFYGRIMSDAVFFLIWVVGFVGATVYVFSRATAHTQYTIIGLFMSNGKPLEV